LEQFGRGKALDDLLTDRALQRMFERDFEILGEAMNRLLRAAPGLEFRITDARRIISLRNILSHGYDSVDHRILWAAFVDHLPRLKTEIDRLIRGRSSADG
jgi:uncharacterized protein with HEPN domain